MSTFVSKILTAAILIAVLPVSAGAQQAVTPVSYHQPFDTFDFLEEDFVARSGLKTNEDRGMTLENGRFGKGLRMNLTPDIHETYDYSGQYLDEVTAAMFRTGAKRKEWTSDNEPFIWGAGKVNTGSGAVAFWVNGPLSEGDLFNQSAMVWGRWERFLLAVTVDARGRLGAHMVDSRYHKHEIVSSASWNAGAWNHVVLNWDKSKGLELFVNGASVASSWESDAWWQTALPGLMHFPMPHVIYDEFYALSRPLATSEIAALMRDNTPPSSGMAEQRTTADRDRLAKAFGINSDSRFPVISPMNEGRVLSFKEITPEFVGDYNIPCFFALDGRYELAWPHPLAVFTPIPGDASHQAEKLDIEVPAGTAFNYVSFEGNLSGIREAMFNPRKNARELFEGDRFFSIPDDDRFYYGATVERRYYPRFTLPFVKGYGAPPDFSGDLHLPLTGETRVHEVGVFDVTEQEERPEYGDMTYYLRSGGELQYRYDFGLRTFYGQNERRLFSGYTSPSETDEGWVDTGYLQRMNIVTRPVTGKECVGGILLDFDMKTESSDDVLLVRFRDPGIPHRIWSHAEVRLKGFENGGRLRLLLDCVPVIMPAGDAVWIDIATLNNAKIKIGGSGGSSIVLKTANYFDSVNAYEMKGLMPVIAECTKAHYQPWLFENIWPDIMKPHSFGGHFDSIMPALAVSRVLPHSTIARQYISLGKLPEGHVSELRKSALIDTDKGTFDINSIPADIPAWAYLQHAVQKFRYNVVEWMVRNQNPDGQLGEGWNDDVFMISGKYDVPLDSCDEARDMYLKFFESLDRTNILKDGWIHITPLDTLHSMDFHSERFQSLIYKLGDPYIVRRSLKTAWHYGKPDQTPQLYSSGLPFRFEHNMLQWYWGLNNRRIYTSPGEEAVISGLTRMIVECDDVHFHRFTDAWNTMRNLSGENLLTGMIIGGWRTGTRSPHTEDRSISVSWPEGGGEDLARWITYSDSVSFKCRMYSFDPDPRQVSFRLFRIDPGTFTVRLSEDRNGAPGAVITEFSSELMRYDTIALQIPSGKPVILTVDMVKKARGSGLFPDLAVASYDCERNGDKLRVLVSNVGSAKSKRTALSLYDADGKRIARKNIPAIDAPVDFVEKSVWMDFDAVPRSGELRVVIDEDNKAKELYRGNNTALVK